jgi:uncharacterized delta-60 repeat protein
MKNILIYLLILVLPLKLIAQAGTLDSSFGVDGQIVTGFDAGTNVTIYKGLVQSDNKIIAVGDFESNLLPYNGFFVMRYLPEGSIDSSFGDSGKTIINLLFEDHLTPSSACLQQDGKILVCGTGTAGWPDIIASGIIVRLNIDGSVDSSFGTDGIVQTTLGNSTSYTAIAVQPDGKILGVGTSTNRFINRFFENGSLDPSFGTNGHVYYSSSDVFYSCITQPNGKILIGGGYYAFPEKFCVKRFLPNGAVDSSFGSSGTVVTQLGSADGYIYDMALQSDGKILALGQSGTAIPSAVVRYNVDGTLDNTFGTDGSFMNFFPNVFAIAHSILIQNDDKILLGGSPYINGKSDYGLQRLTSNSLIDSSFGENGEVATDFANYSGSGIQSIGLQSSGKIIAIGNSINNGFYEISLARYNGDPTQKQQIITKIKRWIQNHNGIEWDNTGNANSYAVQRSADGVNWQTVYRSPLTVHTYSDPAPLNGTNYYRLQTTSTSNAVANSNVIAISNDDNIKVSPNPAQSTVRIEGLSLSQKTKITMVDFNGNVKLQTVANTASYNLNIASLRAGNYILKIETNGEVVTKQFVKE